MSPVCKGLAIIKAASYIMPTRARHRYSKHFMLINSSNPHNNQTKGTFITPLLQMSKLRHGEVR